MDWSNYLYLIGILIAGVALVALATRMAPRLMEPSPRHRRPAELLMLGAIVLLGALAIYWQCLFGPLRFGYWDLGSDTLEQYVPYYIDMINSIKAGTWGVWDFHYGLGATFMAFDTWAYDPFNLITIPLTLLLGTARLGRILALVQVVKILLAAFVFDHVLTFYCKLPLSRMVGGALCGLGGWLLLWGQHYWLGTVYISALLLMLLVELLMERWTAPRFLGLAAVTAASILMGVYSGFMSLLFAAMYALLRAVHVSECKSFGGYLRFIGPMVLSVVSGILAAGIMIVPYANLILNESSRVTNSNGMSFGQRIALYLTSFNPASWLPLILSRILGNSLIVSGDVFPQSVVPYSDSQAYLMNSYEFLMVGVGGGSLILASQSVADVVRKGTWRDRILVLAACALVVLFCINDFLPALFSAFDLKFRASFTVGIVTCIASAAGLDCILTRNRLYWPELLVACALTLGTLTWSLVSTVNGRIDGVFFLAATLLAIACLVTGPGRKGQLSNVAVALLCAAIVAMPVVDGFFCTNLRGIATNQNFTASTEADSDTAEALTYLRETDDGFYRVGKVYSDWSRFNDSLVQGYFGVSAYNSLTDSDVIEFYRKEWPGVISGIAAYQDYSANVFAQSPSNVVGVKYILTKAEADVPWLELTKRCGTVYVYRNTAEPGIISTSTNLMAESTADALSEEERQAALATSIVVPDAVLEGISPDLIPHESEPLSQSQAALEGNSRLTATVNAGGTCVALLAVPHTSGWSVTVDGNSVETFRADYGFIGFELPEGTHQIAATYRPTGVLAGAIVSVAGIFLAFASCIVMSRSRHQNNPRHGAHFA